MRLPESYKKAKFTDFELYCAYLALKQHFTKDSYDFHRYLGKTNAKFASFETRRDRFAFLKLTKHRDPIGLMVSNLIKDPNVWVGDLNEAVYIAWKAKQESLTYSVTEELSKIDDLDDALSVREEGTKPKILRMLGAGTISLETVCLIQATINVMLYWESVMEPAMWADQRSLIKKYLPFLEYDKAKIKAAVEKSLDIDR